MRQWDVARVMRRLPLNVPGEFYVDSSCIDCETCMIVAPEVFEDEGSDQAYVHRQPQDDAARHRALMALVSCPTSSIGTVGHHADVGAAARAFPEPIGGGVHYCGYASDRSYGASSYLVVRQGGNVLVDSPRASEPLLQRIEALGGVRWMFLTHQDDVADHEKFRARFGCERVLHRADVGPRTAGVERVIEGPEPQPLAPDAPDWRVIPVPGHTAGSLCLLWDDDVLFTGDHLWGDGRGNLSAGRSVAWHSWSEQVQSLERLLEYRFRRVLPGHGRRFEAATPEEAHAALAALVARVKVA